MKKKIMMKHCRTYFCAWGVGCFLLCSLSGFAQKTDAGSGLSKSADYMSAIGHCITVKDWDKARSLLDEGVRKFTKDSDIRMLFGQYYYDNEESDSARYQLNKALEFNPKNTEAKRVLINLEIASGRYSSAICYINELLEVSPYDKDLWSQKIEIYRLQKNNVEANRLLKRISQIYPDDPDIQQKYVYALEQEVLSEKSGGEDKSIELLSMLIEKNPLNESYYLGIIANYFKIGDYGHALSMADRGLVILPDSMKLINKKIDILNDLQRQDETLLFIQQKMKTIANPDALQGRYNETMEELAQRLKKKDPYEFYSSLFATDPQNVEAFNYIIPTAITRGLYEDALENIKKAKSELGETKNILLKEYAVYLRMGVVSKIDKMTVKLYRLYPHDTDVQEHYLAYRLKLAKLDMQEQQYNEALVNWQFVAANGSPELKKTALMGMYNCSLQLNNKDEALVDIDNLINKYPNDATLRMKKATLLGEQLQYLEALKSYEQGIQLTPISSERRALGAYDELAAKFTKASMEAYHYPDALVLIEEWLKVYPQSTLANHYAINCCMALNDDENTLKYIQKGLDNNPEDLYCCSKLSEYYNLHKEYSKTLDVLSPILAKNPYNKGLMAIYAEASGSYATQLLKQAKTDSCFVAVEKGLSYVPNDKTLKYVKGLAFEKTMQYDSAYYYQGFYEPAALELTAFESHLRDLKSKTYKNTLGLYLMRNRFSESTSEITYIQAIDYVRTAGKNTYTGTVYYAGRDIGKAVQVQFNYSRQLRPTWTTSFQIGFSNKIFPSFSLNASVLKLLKNDWELEGGLGFKNLNDSTKLYSLLTGVSKEWNIVRWNARMNNFLINGKWYYNVSSQVRLYVDDSRDYIVGMASVGSAPDVDLVENQLYTIFTAQNTMVGLGGFCAINDRLSLGLVGAWYNYEASVNQYRNLYNLNLDLHVRF